MMLYFNPRQLPRSMTRQQWRNTWRWKRVTEAQLAARERDQLKLLVTHGHIMTRRTLENILDNAINPPIYVL
jgi:hypothetical protein